MLYNYSILPLSEHEIDKRVEDIVAQAKGPSRLFPLFMMTLVPEGRPLWDKAGKLSAIYAKYRDALAEKGVESGILIQASLGHGYQIERSSFTPYVRFNDGVEEPVCCPMDEDFLAHFAEVFRTLAREHPKVIMLDDDFRLMWRPGAGCACHLHMAEFNRRAGTDMTPNELYKYITSHHKSDRLARIFTEVQNDSLIRAIKVFRDAVDEVDPSIQGINCTSGMICEAVAKTAPIFAGKGNPTVVRVPNGVYYPNTTRRFSNCMYLAAACGTKLRRGGIDVLLAEADTLPFNRYAKSSRYLHAQYTASILEGLDGAKHWITRIYAFEPQSGKAYRDVLAKHEGMYERLSELSKGISWLGANSYFVDQIDFDYSLGWNPPHSKHWSTYILERMGIPFYFSDKAGKANFLEGSIVSDMSDEQLSELFGGSVFTDGESAMLLCERGFEKELGVNVGPWSMGRISEECFGGNSQQRCMKQPSPYEIKITSDKTEVLSENMLWVDACEAELLAPASTCLQREKRRISAVFCGSVASRFSFEQGFGYLNESRKAQLVSLLAKAGALPVYLVGDDEVCLRAGRIKDGRLLVASYALGTDPVEKPILYLEKKPERITYILPDGREEELYFTSLGNGFYSLDHRMEILCPLILLIQ